MAQDPNGQFTIADSGGDSSAADLNTLFGVNQGVGSAPVLLRAAGPMSQGLSRDPQGGGGVAVSAPMVSQQLANGQVVNGVLNGFYGMDPSALASLQEQLLAGGFYSDGFYSGKAPKRPAFGTPDEDSFAAFKTAVVRAVRSGHALPDVINEAVQTRTEQGAGTITAQPIQLTNADDLRATFTAVAKRRTGKNPDPALIDRMVDSFHKSEADAQTAAYSVAANGGTYTQAASPEAFATQQVESQDPVDAQTHDYLDAMNTFMGMLKSANVGPV